MHDPELKVLRSVVEQLMRFLPSERISASAILSLMSSNVEGISDSESGFDLTCVALYNASEISQSLSVKSNLAENSSSTDSNYFKSAEWRVAVLTTENVQC